MKYNYKVNNRMFNDRDDAIKHSLKNNSCDLQLINDLGIMTGTEKLSSMIQYYHKNFGSKPATFCCYVPHLNSLLSLVERNSQREIVLKIGVAFVHPNDQYSKKIGRITSLTKVKDYNFRINNVDYYEDYIVLILTCMTSPLHQVAFKIYNNSTRAHFVYCN